jgi:hypothetical protein
MAAITDLSDLVNRLTGGNSGTPEIIMGFKDGRVDAAAAAAPIAGRATSLWTYEGQPSGGAAPGAVAAPTNATTGGLIQTDPGGGRTKWLTGFYVCANTTGTVILYDRLLHISGLNGTTTTAQTVGGTLTRYTDGIGNQIWIEIYTQIGTTATTFTCEYTDQGSNPSQVTTATAIGGTGLREAQRIIPAPLASGDYGVQAVANVDLLASTTTAGDFGVTVVHPLAHANLDVAGAGQWVDLLRGAGPVEIKTGACLALAFMANTTTVPFFWYQAVFVEA